MGSEIPKDWKDKIDTLSIDRLRDFEKMCRAFVALKSYRDCVSGLGRHVCDSTHCPKKYLTGDCYSVSQISITKNLKEVCEYILAKLESKPPSKPTFDYETFDSGLKEFKVGHYYRWCGPKVDDDENNIPMYMSSNGSSSTFVSAMFPITDGKPRKCINVSTVDNVEFEGIRNSWWWPLKWFEEVKQGRYAESAQSKSPTGVRELKPGSWYRWNGIEEVDREANPDWGSATYFTGRMQFFCDGKPHKCLYVYGRNEGVFVETKGEYFYWPLPLMEECEPPLEKRTEELSSKGWSLFMQKMLDSRYGTDIPKTVGSRLSTTGITDGLYEKYSTDKPKVTMDDSDDNERVLLPKDLKQIRSKILRKYGDFK